MWTPFIRGILPSPPARLRRSLCKVSQVNTNLTLTANPPEQMLTMPVTFTAQLASLSNEPPFANPTGTVSFFDQSLGGQLLGTAAMGANGQAVFTTTAIGPGTMSLAPAMAEMRPSCLAAQITITEQIDDLLINRVGNNNTDYPARHHGRLYPPGDSCR